MKLFAALKEEAQQGWVWLQSSTLAPRAVIKIKNRDNGKVVYCEALQIDDNFLKNYNKDNNAPSSQRHEISDPANALVINYWYRAKPGRVSTQTEVPLDITPLCCCNSWWGKFRACTDHPQIVIRMAAWLGLISVFLGVVGVVLSVVSICRT